MSFYFWYSVSQNTPVSFDPISPSFPPKGTGEGKRHRTPQRERKKLTFLLGKLLKWAEENGKVSECSPTPNAAVR